MAEFCLKCWNKINDTNDDESMYVMSRDLDLCDCCGEFTHIIVRECAEYELHSDLIEKIISFIKRLYSKSRKS